MPRQSRTIIPNFPYHILNRGNNKEVVFFKDEDYRFFLQQSRKYKLKFGLILYHYCLMPNHFHFLGEPKTNEALRKFMHGIELVYAQYFQRKYGKVGHVWQGRYKSPVIEKDDYLMQCGYYIEDNPRRAKLVENLREWPWSSYHFYAFGKSDPMVDIDPNYLKLGVTPNERQEYYRQFMLETVSESWLQGIRQNLDQGILGAEGFIKDVLSKFEIRLVRVGKRGRPPKNIM